VKVAVVPSARTPTQWLSVPLEGWDIGTGRFKQFVRTGVGLAAQATYPGPAWSTTVVFLVGLGVHWELDSRRRFFGAPDGSI
jgi:hypothetical protein